MEIQQVDILDLLLKCLVNLIPLLISNEYYLNLSLSWVYPFINVQPTMNHLLEYVQLNGHSVHMILTEIAHFCQLKTNFIPKTISDIHDLARNVFKSVKCRY